MPLTRPFSSRSRGVALVMALGAIAVLTVMLAELQDEASVEASQARAMRDRVQAEYLARSAIHLSRLLLASEPVLRQGVAPLFTMMKMTPPQLPVWEFTDRLLAAFSQSENAESFADMTGVDLSLGQHLGLPEGRFEVTVVDEDRLINVNLGFSNEIAGIRLAKQIIALLMPPQYNTLFEQPDARGEWHSRQQICQSMVEWTTSTERGFSCDMNQHASAGGIKDTGYYQQRAKPYRLKNAPYDSLEELRLVRGISDTFWSTFVDPEPSKPNKRNLTVWGQGKINVNTANGQTLLAAVCSWAPKADVCVDPEQMQKFLTGVLLARGFTMGVPLFATPQEFIAAMKGEGLSGPLLRQIGVKPVIFQSESEFAKSITTESKIFSLYAVGSVKRFRREIRVAIHAVVDFRDTPPLRLLSPLVQAQAAQATEEEEKNSSDNAEGIAAALRPDPGGTLVYFRIE